jgi:tight adherence protein C
MIPLVILTVGLVGISGRLVARAIVVPRMQLKHHLREIRDYGFDSVVSDREFGSAKRMRGALRRRAQRLGAFMMARFPSVKALAPGELAAAGFYDVTPEAVHGYRAMGAVGLPSFFLLLILSSGNVSIVDALLIFVSAAAGWALPSFLIRKRGSSRLEEVDHALPELIDVLIATVEAGMGFGASLDLVANRFRGPIGDELRLTMKQQSLGISLQQALEDMAGRCDTPSVRAFVRATSRGESMGISIGSILRELSHDMRRRRGQAAREKMQKAPVKMIFPLMFLIFPALMIVLMYPAAYSLMHNLSGV